MRIEASARILASNTEARTLTGRIVTFGEVGHTSAGPTVFEPGSITWDSMPVLNFEHDRTRPLGRAISMSETPENIDSVFKIAATTSGNDALIEAADGLRDGFSVGVEVSDYRIEHGVMIVTASRLDHVGQVTDPAIKSARITDVAASEHEAPAEEADTETPSADPGEDNTIEEGDTVDESTDTVAEVTAAHVPARTAPRVQPFADRIDYVHTAVLAAQGDDQAALRLTAADQTLSDNPTSVPTPVVGELINDMNADRPIISSARSLPLPQYGKSFERPKITQHTQVGAQANELDALASRTFTTTGIAINKGTFGGVLRLSFQDRDWSDPAMIAIALADFDLQYARDTEAACAAELVDGTTGSQTLAANAAADAVLAAIYGAAGKVKAACGRLPNVAYASIDQWERLGSLVDTTKRPIFPTLAPSNASGQMDAASFSGNPLGLRLIVSEDLPDGTLKIGNSQRIEWYENGPWKGETVDLNVLGVTIAIYGYAATKVITGGAFVDLAPAS